MAKAVKPYHLIGQKFGRLLILSFSDRKLNGLTTVWAQCDCGNKKEYRLQEFKKGTKSCGCQKREDFRKRSTIHGLYKTPIYSVWQGMKARCSDPKRHNSKSYVGKGIVVCNEWLQNPQTFIQWALANGYQKGLQIDRRNNDGNYEPSNCRFVTTKVNQRNTSKNNLISYKGETKTVAEWAELIGLKYHTIYKRIQMGWSTEKAFLTSLKKSA